MKKLFASVSYSFNNFYNNLNTQGQIVFSIIIFLIILLSVILFIVYIVDNIKTKKRTKNIKKEEKVNISKEEKINTSVKVEEKTEETSVSDIANEIENALNEKKPITLTNFEEDQEKTAIISIDELMKKAKELELIDDEDENVNYIEKYNLASPIVDEKLEEDKDKLKEVKAFRVSQVISPIYGVKKDVIEGNKKA